MKIHSYFSLKYGIYSPETLAEWGVGAGYSFLFLADINHTGSALAFVREAQRLGIRAVVGVELRNGMQTVATLMARNNRGIHEMNRFITPFLHKEQPFPVALPHFSNCWVFYPLETVLSRSLFEHEFFQVDLACLPHWELRYANKCPREKAVLLTPMIFQTKRDFNCHRLLRAIHHNVLLSKLSAEQHARGTEVLLSQDALIEACGEYVDFWERTKHCMEDCEVSFAFGDEALPQNPASYTGSKIMDEQLLRKLCAEGAAYRYPQLNDEIVERIEKEVELITQKDYLSYFLIAWDFTSYARSRSFFYVGRGSGANSIVAYLLRITDVDPLELDLYFERFINLYRKNPPDFDIDFSWKDRDEIVRYIFEKYPNAAWLCTYNTFQYKATVRELGKVFGLPKAEIDKLSNRSVSLQQADSMSSLVLRYASYLQDMPSHLSVHSGGIVISEQPITWFSATFMPPKGFPTTQFSMLEAEDVGLYKFDVLSQRGLGKIRETLDIVAYNQPGVPLEDIHNIAHFKEDPKIRTLLLEAKALGCFYVESPAMRMLMVKLKVTTYLELVAASSIIRPGVSQSGMMKEYILRHRDPSRRAMANPLLVEIMPETYGVMVYQEDVIKVAHYFAGLTLAEADVLRRGMSGKFRSREEFTKVRQRFYTNCAKRGYDSELVESVWNQIASFAGYAFAKGHSASYAVESYQSLYLKAYFPVEYMTATVNNFGGYYRTEIYVHEARKYGAQIEAPCVLEGSYPCILQGKRLILGFLLVEGLESEGVLNMLKERHKNGQFKDFEDFINRMRMPLDQIAILIRIGAFRRFDVSRKQLLWQAYYRLSKAPVKTAKEALFFQPTKQFILPDFEEHPMEEVFDQLDLLGFPLCNPFDLLSEPIPKHTPAAEIPCNRSLHIETYGYLVTVKRSKTGRGDYMHFGTFLDIHGDTIDTVHFPESGRKYPFQGKGIYRLKGMVSEAFDYYSIEVGEMSKLRWMDDVRYRDAG
ncbi:MAG: DNA polymerase III subunit alpha [Bacteroidetes bacterium]|nr:DNA polymerase III subunit alpha [Bacteroidota bacterium]MBM3424379.1 DNA polymerase III subunit alpha [Bacteroidota bacterium]